MVLMMSPPSPLAQPCFSSAKETAKSAVPVPEFFFIHVCPPSVVFSTVPLSPTAHPTCGSMKRTFFSSTSSGKGCWFHVVPPSLVCRIVALLPTIHPCCASTKKTSEKEACHLDSLTVSHAFCASATGAIESSSKTPKIDSIRFLCFIKFHSVQTYASGME